jgi:hypothetical protein
MGCKALAVLVGDGNLFSSAYNPMITMDQGEGVGISKYHQQRGLRYGQNGKKKRFAGSNPMLPTRSRRLFQACERHDRADDPPGATKRRSFTASQKQTSVPLRAMFWRFGRNRRLTVVANGETVSLHLGGDTGVAAIFPQRGSDFQAQSPQQFGAPEVQNPNFVLRTLVFHT